jgi:hypothetical protein
MDVNATTSAITFTENNGTVNAARGVVGATEVLSLTETQAPINSTRYVTGAVELTVFVENAALVGIYRATIANTMVTFSQDADALGGLFNSIFDTVLISELLSSFDQQTLTERVLVADEMRVIYGQTLTSTVNISDSRTYNAGPMLHDTVYVSDVLRMPSQTTLLHPPGPKAYEHLEYFFSEILVSTVQLSSSFPYLGREGELKSTVNTSSVLSASTTARDTLTSTVEIGSEMEIGLRETLTSTVNASDTQVGDHQANATLTSTVNIGSTPSYAVAWFAALVDTVRASEVLAFGSSISNATLISIVEVSEVIWAADLAALAWVLNTETGGLSTYDNFGFGSVAAHDGVLYATSPAGVFQITADTDSGREIAAEVRTGFLDFDDDYEKQMSDLYVGYTGGALQCEVETYDGPRDVYTYQFEEREANAPRNNRMKIGRGLKSRYWRFGIKNINGADFQLQDMTGITASSKSRRL